MSEMTVCGYPGCSTTFYLVPARGDAAQLCLEHAEPRFGVDTATSASRQHWIDTGDFLLIGEAIQ